MAWCSVVRWDGWQFNAVRCGAVSYVQCDLVWVGGVERDQMGCGGVKWGADWCGRGGGALGWVVLDLIGLGAWLG